LLREGSEFRAVVLFFFAFVVDDEFINGVAAAGARRFGR
jgi:hypothetical protein